MILEFFRPSHFYACGVSCCDARYAETQDPHAEGAEIAKARGFVAYRVSRGTMFDAVPVSEIVRVSQ